MSTTENEKENTKHVIKPKSEVKKQKGKVEKNVDHLTEDRKGKKFPFTLLNSLCRGKKMYSVP